MKKLLLISTFLFPTIALAGSSTISVTPGTGATYAVGTNGATNFFSLTGVCDGSAAANCMAVKAASTAPVATDPAAVVAISPNSPMVGTAGTAGTSVFSVQGIASMTPLLATVSQATAANLNATVVGTGTFAVQLNTTPTLANGNGVVPTQSGTALSAGNPSFAALSIGGTLDSATNGIYANILQGNAALSPTNGVFANILQGNAALSGSNPSFAALSIGSAVDSATNGIYVNLLQGNAVNAVGNPIFASITNTPAVTCSTCATSANQSTEITSLATIATNSGLASNLATATTGGDTSFHVIAANSNNSTLISTGAHTVYEVQVTNYGTNLGDLRLYDLAGAPTCSSATGVIRNWPAQSNATSPGYTYSFPLGIAIASGLGICFTGAVADNDNTSFAGTNAAINIGYK